MKSIHFEELEKNRNYMQMLWIVWGLNIFTFRKIHTSYSCSKGRVKQLFVFHILSATDNLNSKIINSIIENKNENT